MTGSTTLARVAIVMSTYNGAAYLPQQVDSLLAQTHSQWELIVRDDGSRDETPALLDTYAAADLRIKICRDTLGNLGVVQAFSHLLQTCRRAGYDYVFLCDQDDVWHADKVERTLQHMRQRERAHPGTPILVHTDLELIDGANEIIHPSMWDYIGIDPALNRPSWLLLTNTVTGCTALLNRPLLDLLKPIPAEAEMHDWWIALLASLGGFVSVLPAATIGYRQHGQNVAGAPRMASLAAFPRKGWRLLTSATQRNRHTRLLEGAARQAGALAEQYPRLGPEPARRMVRIFGHIKSLGWIQQRWFLLRHRIFRQRFRYNLSLFLLP